MHTIQIYIDEKLDSTSLNELKTLMMGLPHVTNVEVDIRIPHDLFVEFEANFNIPMSVIDQLHHKGLHPNIFSA